MFIDLEQMPPGFEAFVFPGGEHHVKLPDFLEETKVYVDARLATWDDFGRLALLLNALHLHEEVTAMDIFIPYFPGARQDRTDNRSPCTVSLMAAFLAATTELSDINCEYYTFDIHSKDGLTQAKRHIDIVNLNVDILSAKDFDLDIEGIICPDHGALERARIFRESFYLNVPIVTCDKKRDFVSGKLSMEYHMPVLDPSIGKWLVVDDICDGGATFNILADAFSERSNAELQLYVSHGIFSKGVDALSDLYSKIYTTNSRGYGPINALAESETKHRLAVIPLLPRVQD